MKLGICIAVTASVLGLALMTGAMDLSAQATNRDNTQVNKRDRNPGEVTADQQKGNPSDVKITQQIRQSITRDKSLSTYAKNIKIITQNGNVTLKGPVRTEEDKRALESKAAQVAGAGHVKNEIDIVVKQNNSKAP